MKKFFGFLKKELLEMLPPTVFFFCVFHVVVFTRALMDDKLGVNTMTSFAATIGALIIGKSILIADALPFWRRMDNYPRVYLMLARTLVYALIALAFQFLEEFLPLLKADKSGAAAATKLFDEIYWPHFWSTHIQLLLYLSLYNIIAVMAEALGKQRLYTLLFTRGTQTTGAQD